MTETGVLRSHDYRFPSNKPGSHSRSNSSISLCSKQTQPNLIKKIATSVTKAKRTKSAKEGIPKKPEVIICCDSDSSDELPSFMACTKKPRLDLDRIIKPTWKEYLAENKELAEYKKKVAQARQLVAEDDSLEVNNWPTFSTGVEESKQPKQPTLDCKHLPLEEIKNYFYLNSTYLRDVMAGKQYSSRHFQYENRQKSKLTASFSMIVFTFDQLHEMANLMSKNFDSENQKDEYFFKVLIPDLCLLIFMDSHEMSKEEATKYLENHAVD